MFKTYDGQEVYPYLNFDASGRVRWKYQNEDRYEVLVVPEPVVPAPLVREFIKAHPEAGWDIGEMSDEEANAYSIVNADDDRAYPDDDR